MKSQDLHDVDPDLLAIFPLHALGQRRLDPLGAARQVLRQLFATGLLGPLLPTPDVLHHDLFVRREPRHVRDQLRHSLRTEVQVLLTSCVLVPLAAAAVQLVQQLLDRQLLLLVLLQQLLVRVLDACTGVQHLLMLTLQLGIGLRASRSCC